MSELALGPEVVERLIPQRFPLRLVDRVIEFSPGDRPSLRAQKMIGANEPVFVGHFPGLALWPGAYTIEALGQACNLLAVLVFMARAYAERGGSADVMTTDLRALDALYRLDPRAREVPAALAEMFLRPPLIGMSSSVDIKLLEPVFAGQTLELVTTLTHMLGDAGRFAVEAWSLGRPVARGSIASSARFSLPGKLG